MSLVPWAMFFVASALSAVGAAGPATVAMVAPVGIGFALRYRIRPVAVGLMIVNGGSAGSFSPIGIFGSITNNVVERSGLHGRARSALFFVCMLFNVVLGVVIVALFRGSGGEHVVGGGRRG